MLRSYRHHGPMWPWTCETQVVTWAQVYVLFLIPTLMCCSGRTEVTLCFLPRASPTVLSGITVVQPLNFLAQSFPRSSTCSHLLHPILPESFRPCGHSIQVQ